MRHLLLHFIRFSILFVGTISFLLAQNSRPVCGTDLYNQQQAMLDPDFNLRKAEVNRFIQQRLADGTNASRGTVYNIPVVFHIVYNDPADNISDAQIMTQLDVLNEDFRRINADTINTPGPFKPVAADVEIEFCIAQVDPNGNATNGITRTQTNATSFNTNNNVKSSATGGADPWPSTDYLNIWIAPLGGGLLGYSSGAGQAGTAVDGVVIGTEYTGRGFPNLSPGFDLGRTATHEVGHWLGLEHTWGPGGCAGDDGIADTPMQDSPNFGCATFPSVSCPAGAPNGDMFMNYMDYSDDACFNLFTLGQTAVMRSLFDPGGPRESLLLNTNCQSLNVADLAIEAILDPNSDQCGGKSRAEVLISNNGTNDVTSAQLNYFLDGSLLAINFWSGLLEPGESEIVVFPSFNVSIGTHTFFVQLENPNGLPDINDVNDTLSSAFEALNNAGIKIPFFEGFESGAFPPADWQIANFDNNTGWSPATVGRDGSSSAYMNNYTYSTFGEADELLTPGLDLTPFGKVGLSFQVSYAKYATNSGFTDTLEVWVSGDCGKTFTRKWVKYGQELATAPATTAAFVPSKLSEWRKEWVDLTDFTDSTYVVIKFRNITNYENNIYIDNININEIFALDVEDEISGLKVNLAPNPAKDFVNLLIDSERSGNYRMEVIDMTGKLIRKENHQVGIGSNEIQISTIELPRGIYLVKLSSQEGEVIRKLALE